MPPMSATESSHAAESQAAPLFDAAELKQFAADDVEAGRGICKLLSSFFFYTVVVMALSTYITYRWVTQ
jgi:hypothetical protein